MHSTTKTPLMLLSQRFYDVTMTFQAHAAMMVPQAGILSTNSIDEDGERYEFPHENKAGYFTSIYGEALVRALSKIL